MTEVTLIEDCYSVFVVINHKELKLDFNNVSEAKHTIAGWVKYYANNETSFLAYLDSACRLDRGRSLVGNEDRHNAKVTLDFSHIQLDHGCHFWDTTRLWNIKASYMGPSKDGRDPRWALDHISPPPNTPQTIFVVIMHAKCKQTLLTILFYYLSSARSYFWRTARSCCV